VTWMNIKSHKLLSKGDESRLLKDHDPIIPLAIDTSSLAPSLVFPESITAETVAVAMVLEAAWRWLEMKGANSASKRGMWTQHGYLDCSKRWFLRELKSHQAPIPGSTITVSSQDVIDLLKPSKLQVLYPAGKRIIIDLLQASRILDGTIYRAADGPNANVWGSDFESRVQQIIDTSSWRPPDELRSLIGRVIRTGGNAVTDIDAVAMADDTLLLIDTKAFRVSEQLAAGEYSATLTMRERVESASVKWKRIIALVRQDPQMLQVPIPQDLKIDGLVILPFIPYVHLGAATDRVLSLLRASGITELLVAAGRSGQVTSDPS
jgi:hypothetical protein